MKITILDCSEGEEEEIIIKCRNMDEQLLRTIYALKAGREKITVSKEDKTHADTAQGTFIILKQWITEYLSTWRRKFMKRS